MLSIAVSAVAVFILGWLWYSPWMFGQRWMALRGIDTDSSQSIDMLGPMLAAAVTSLLMAASLHYVVHWIGINDWIAALRLGLLIGVGVLALSRFSDTMFHRGNLTLWLIESGFRAVSVLLTVLILVAFRL
ncbi:DUF1761 domain-containing protein [Gammaproteobacteria bacterium]|nr:DUF1761 domain-containing protein [Gammaproteobacteria bacterium]